MSLLTAPIVKNNHIFAGNYFIFQKKWHEPNLLVPNLDISEKNRKTVIKQDKFLNLVALYLKLC